MRQRFWVHEPRKSHETTAGPETCFTELQVRLLLIVRSQAENLGTTPISGQGFLTRCQRPRLQSTRTTTALRGGGLSGRTRVCLSGGYEFSLQWA